MIRSLMWGGGLRDRIVEGSCYTPRQDTPPPKKKKKKKKKKKIKP